MQKLQVLQSLYNTWTACRHCSVLCDNRTNVVFGYGQYEKTPIHDPNTKEVIGLGGQIVIVGEAPGTHEDTQGFPFVGKSGMLLNQYLASVSARPEVKEKLKDFSNASGDVAERHNYNLRELLKDEFFFTNVVACRPPENRDPTPKEIAACKPRLMEIIYTIDPVLIIAVGRIAIESLVNKKVSITQARGQLFDISFPGKMAESFSYPVLATLHPSYLMRKNDFNQKGGEGAKTYRDFLRAMRLVDDYNFRNYGIKHPPLRPKDVD